ncbi:MAG: LPXTG cell wall anchor domain-containing protein, partial [Oscillospiraceae bacterium]|nr:LPXTG cell wall anchor domain-containing protein [Candidatus Equicaccousia limihippi]
KTQPKDVLVGLLDGTTFTVEPQNPADVASYQWYFVDSVGREFELEGTSAHTNTLIFPAVYRSCDGCYVYCMLSDASGNTTQSEFAYMDLTNPQAAIPALYVGNYAVKRGQTLDLSTTELGSGKISFPADGQSVSLDNVNYDNSEVILDYTISDSIGIMLNENNTDITDFTLNCIGSNTVKNVFYQDSTNGSGITLDFYFFGKGSYGEAPAVNIKGNGNLNVVGGTIQLRTNGDLNIGVPITFKANGDYFCDALNGYNVTVQENIPLKFDVNGTLIYAVNNINIKKGANIDAKTSAPFVLNDYTNKNGFLCTNNVTVDNATVKMQLTADPNRFIPFESGIYNFLGINCKGDLKLNNANVQITETAGEGAAEYFYGGGGVSCNALNVTSSILTVNLNSKAIIDTYGIKTKEGINITNSMVNCYNHTSGRVFGIAATGDLTVKDSYLTSDSASADDEAYALMYKTANIDLHKYGQKVEAITQNGFAMGANLGNGADQLGFDEEYEITATTLGEHTVFATPADAAINRASMKMSTGKKFIYLETPYSLADKTAAAQHVLITSDQKSPQPGTEPEPTPKKEVSPKTGDTDDTLPLALAVVTLLCAALLIAYRKRCK